MNKIRTIYTDFDGTITKKDAVNGFLEIYEPDKWLESEQLWIDGKISSMENAIRQVGLLPKLTAKNVIDYIDSIEIDEYFLDFVKFTKENNLKLVILSDGFDLFIKKTLEKHGINDIEIFANHFVHLEDGSFKIEFPYHNLDCKKHSGMCKCQKIKEDEFIYIGDGTSDLCVAQKADILFATKRLKTYCEKNSIKHIPFNNFKDIKNVIEENILKREVVV